jgi:hypothetical protein
MSETLNVERIGRTAVTAIELVYSPDDGGYYLSHADFRTRKSRTSVRIYASAEAAKADWHAGTVEWDAWS